MSKVEVLDGVNNLHVSDEHSVKGYKLIDVRRPEEFTGELGHIKGSLLVTLGMELESYLESAPKDDNYLFICRSGGRSTQAARLAQSKGFAKVTNLAGGMLHWNELALKTEK
jgi:rhodanese-related sulfurtransferase